jgi:serine/threonine-protein kinase
MSADVERINDALGDRYTLERELGRGGMATVYLAQDRKHDRQVAIKVLRPELSVTLGSERFLREIQIEARLNHPHILPLHDSGQANGFLYYVMPYVEGESLRDRLKREGPLPVDESLQISKEVASALDYAHDAGLVHRDIKPENILLSAGKAVVADFGIARAVDEAGGEQLTATGMSVGTPAYMSPEQAAGEKEIDARTDLYALGCVLYEMLTGEPPFAGPSPQAVMARKVSEPAPGFREQREEV